MVHIDRQATDLIRQDLRDFRRARHLALGVYLMLLAVFLVAMEQLPGGVKPEGTAWGWAIAAFIVGCALSTGLALGVPLLHGWAFTGALGLSITLMVGGLVVASFVQHDGTAGDHPGGECFTAGTVISGLAMLVLGAVSGRLWRRFPDPGFALAVGTTFAGVMALHMRCGSFELSHLMLFHLAPLAVMYGAARLLTQARLRLLD